MLKTIHATNDSKVLHPEELVDLGQCRVYAYNDRDNQTREGEGRIFFADCLLAQAGRSGRLVELYQGLPLRKREWDGC